MHFVVVVVAAAVIVVFPWQQNAIILLGYSYQDSGHLEARLEAAEPLACVMFI